MRSAVVFLGVALGESVPRFDIVMSLIGGTLTGPLIFILPPLIYSKLRGLYVKRMLSISTYERQYFNSEKRINSVNEIFNKPEIHLR
jgi:vesicular inhibitory amino acid transporter